MLYLGHKMTALEAKHYGFVNEIYEYENLNKVWTYLQKLTELSSEVYFNIIYSIYAINIISI